MAIHAYRCRQCGFEIDISITGTPEQEHYHPHDNCENHMLRRVWYPVAINLGWQPVKGHDNVDKWMFEHGNRD